MPNRLSQAVNIPKLHTLNDNLMSLTTFDQLTYWLLNTGKSQEINMFERILVKQTPPEVATKQCGRVKC